MDITTTHEQGRVPVTVFHLKGDLNVNTYEQLEQTAHKAVEGGARNVLLDLAEVPYVSSAGIRAVNHIFQLLRGDAPGESDAAIEKGLRAGTFKSPHVKLLNPTPRVAEVLKVAGVDMFLEIHHDLKSAVASFG